MYDANITANIHPEFAKQLKQEDKEALLNQKGAVIWLIGLSGSGKSTIANAMEKKLHAEGKFVVILDGDNLRSGINAGLGFSDADREENIRRAAEIAKLFARNGAIVLASLITPLERFRTLVKGIIGSDYIECYVKASFEKCFERDVKGLYAKQKAGEISHFTGNTSNFEEPSNPHLILDTETSSEEQSVNNLYNYILPRISRQSKTGE
jgi:adenylylsulfate kinase